MVSNYRIRNRFGNILSILDKNDKVELLIVATKMTGYSSSQLPTSLFRAILGHQNVPAPENTQFSAHISSGSEK